MSNAFARQREQTNADLASTGVNPNSGKYAFVKRGLGAAEGLGEAGAFTSARDRVRQLAYNTLVGMAGKGDAKIGQSISAAQAGGNQYAQLQQNEMNWQNQNNDMSGIGAAVGTALPYMAMLSSKKAKKNRRQLTEGAATKAIRKMPAQSYQYKRGLGPPGQHVGPMAEDMKAATGMGDGMTIAPQDMMGLNMAATQELDRRVRRLEKR